ncbi:hypothetical protein Daesc_008261 [Daldinia eschscholtzii]|uniref:Ankyrin repeat protein n=1 Tax=Daldinia eschscholtzii TaxID=292717 RepID=A0AAX6MB75_9PEZI
MESSAILPPREGGVKKYKIRDEIVLYRPDSMRNLIDEGMQEEFQKREIKISHKTRLHLARYVVKKYPRNIPGENGNALADPLQRRKIWLALLFGKKLPNNASRTIAEMLLETMNQREKYTDAYEGEVDIFMSILDGEPNLLSDSDTEKRTIIHIAAIHGVQYVFEVCERVLLNQCGCNLGGHRPYCERLSDMLQAKDSEDYTPLHHAISKGRTVIVVHILNRYNRISAEEIRELLQHAISVDHEAKEAMIDELLLLRKNESHGQQRPEGGRGKKYREDIVNEDTLRKAIVHFNPKVFRQLLSLSHANLKLESCGLFHYAIINEKHEAAIALLDRYSELAIQWHDPEYSSESPASGVERRGRKKPIFSFLDSNVVEPLRQRFLEALMENLSISELRDHLIGPAWFGKEISFNIASLAFDPSLAPIMASIEAELNAKTTLPIVGSPTKTTLGVRDPAIVATHSQHLKHKLSGISDGIEFEHALKHVNIPSFEAGTPKRRTEAVSILQWLRKCKNVKCVFKLRVQDSRHHPHSEEDIEKALEKLDVRELDWRRVDLSVTSVFEAIPGVEKLWLYSSGSMVALDHWLGENGLRKLPKVSLFESSVLLRLIYLQG